MIQLWYSFILNFLSLGRGQKVTPNVVKTKAWYAYPAQPGNCLLKLLILLYLFSITHFSPCTLLPRDAILDPATSRDGSMLPTIASSTAQGSGTYVEAPRGTLRFS